LEGEYDRTGVGQDISLGELLVVMERFIGRRKESIVVQQVDKAGQLAALVRC
jgi:hypothetical protein